MMNRTQQILAVILVVQVALSAFVLWPRGATGGIEPLFPNLEAEDIVALTITDDQGQTIELRQVTGSWILPEAEDYPCDPERISPVLDTILGLDTRRLVTRTDASHKRLQVAANDFLRRVDLDTADGSRHTLYLGSSPSYGTSHVRVDGRNETYLASDLSQWDLNALPTSWVNVTYFNVSQDEITQVTLENASGTIVFTRDAQNNWTLADIVVPEQLDTAEISSTISRMTSITLQKPLGRTELDAYGMDDPNAVVTLNKDGEVITLLVGSQDAEDNSYVVKVSTSPYYVRVSNYSAQSMVENTRADFLQPLPTPTPAS